MVNILHYPRLDTVLMVEKAIQDAEDHLTKIELWRSLPNKMQYQTIKLIFDYLEQSAKTMIRKDKIIWTYNPELLKNIREQGLIIE